MPASLTAADEDNEEEHLNVFSVAAVTTVYATLLITAKQLNLSLTSNYKSNKILAVVDITSAS